jgi:hypothetical protein
VSEVTTGPALFQQGQMFLANAKEALLSVPDAVDYRDRPDDLAEDRRSAKESAVAFAAVASACFAGAQASAMAMLGAEDANDDALADEWRRVVGDRTDGELAAERNRVVAEADDAAAQAAEDETVGA